MHEAESSCEPGGSDVVRELWRRREPAMFQIGLQGEVLIGYEPGYVTASNVHDVLNGCGLPTKTGWLAVNFSSDYSDCIMPEIPRLWVWKGGSKNLLRGNQENG